MVQRESLTTTLAAPSMSSGSAAMETSSAVTTTARGPADFGIGRPRRLPAATMHKSLGSAVDAAPRSEEHTSELQSLMRISYADFCLKKKKSDNKANE